MNDKPIIDLKVGDTVYDKFGTLYTIQFVPEDSDFIIMWREGKEDFSVLTFKKCLVAEKFTYTEPKLNVGEIVVCSAVKATSGEVIRGHRHADCIHTLRRMDLKPSSSPSAQGFNTSKNRYVTREQGRKLQDAAGIKSTDPEGYKGNTLFSEDLY